MLSTTSLVTKLILDFPQFTFAPSDFFGWSPDTRTIYCQGRGRAADLLHELAHALLEHRTYTRDISLLEMERDAWHYAKITLGPRYWVKISEIVVETALDTYRDWLHARSVCPTCGSTGLQTDTHTYTCLACTQVWQVNDARICSLRRYKLTKT
jgi:hypothetical protein